MIAVPTIYADLFMLILPWLLFLCFAAHLAEMTVRRLIAIKNQARCREWGQPHIGSAIWPAASRIPMFDSARGLVHSGGLRAVAPDPWRTECRKLSSSMQSARRARSARSA